MVLGEPKPVGIPQPHLQQGQPAALEQAQAAMPPQPHLSPFKPHSQQQQQQQVQVQQQQAEALLYGEGTTYAGVHHPAAVCSVPVMEVRDWGPLAPPGEGHEEQPTEASMEHRAQRSNIRHSGHSHQEQQEQGHAVFSNKRARLGHPNPTEAASVSAATMNGWQRSQHPHHDDHPLSHALANCKRLGQQQQQQQQQRGSRAPYFTPSGPQGAPACGQDLSGTKQERAEEERALDSVQRAIAPETSWMRLHLLALGHDFEACFLFLFFLLASSMLGEALKDDGDFCHTLSHVQYQGQFEAEPQFQSCYACRHTACSAAPYRCNAEKGKNEWNISEKQKTAQVPCLPDRRIEWIIDTQ
eukprot:823364-Pelagomonas_calceolata.AAC.3